MSMKTSERRVAVKVWCDADWLFWLDALARHEEMSLPGVTAAALVQIARENQIPVSSSISNQIRPSNQGYTSLIPRGHYSFYYWPEAREWIKSLAVTLGESVGSLIERALSGYAAGTGFRPPPPRTRVRKCIPRTFNSV